MAEIADQAYELTDLAVLKPHPDNPRQGDVGAIHTSIEANGFYGALIAQRSTGYVLAGNHRMKAALAAGLKELPVLWVDVDDVRAKKILLADNRTNDLASYDEDALASILKELAEQDELLGTGYDGDDLDELLKSLNAEPVDVPSVNRLADEFGVPPFSVLSARDGWWQDRKKAWIDLGIQSEVGRVPDALGLGDVYARQHSLYEGSTIRDPQAYKNLKHKNAIAPPEGAASGISIFDPVLTELLVRWFSPPGETVLDPFAGGSVRGVVAAKLGRPYVGIELRPEQIASNLEQIADIGVKGIEYHEGDSREVLTELTGPYGFLLTCPPYADLEVYSDDPRDLSTMDYDEFLTAYRDIIAKSCALLDNDRFAAIVVSEVRDKKGVYRGFVPDTIAAFEDAGLRFYNEAILVTMVASASVRARRQFTAGRKLCRTHQNVLLFVKGCHIKATKAVGDVAFKEWDLDESHVPIDQGNAVLLDEDGDVIMNFTTGEG